MAPFGGIDLTLKLYGLEIHGFELDGRVLSDRLRRLLMSLRKLDDTYNSTGHHKFMVSEMNSDDQGAEVSLREKQMKAKAIRKSPSKRFAEIGASIHSGGAADIRNEADEYAAESFGVLSKNAGSDFGYDIVKVPEIQGIRIDSLLEKQVARLLSDAAESAESAPLSFFAGRSIGSYDGVMKAVDLRGTNPKQR